MWREAMPEDRAVICFFAGWIGVFIAAFGSASEIAVHGKGG
jgi:hypothetical protein